MTLTSCAGCPTGGNFHAGESSTFKSAHQVWPDTHSYLSHAMAGKGTHGNSLWCTRGSGRSAHTDVDMRSTAIPLSHDRHPSVVSFKALHCTIAGQPHGPLPAGAATRSRGSVSSDGADSQEVRSPAIDAEAPSILGKRSTSAACTSTHIDAQEQLDAAQHGAQRGRGQCSASECSVRCRKRPRALALQSGDVDDTSLAEVRLSSSSYKR